MKTQNTIPGDINVITQKRAKNGLSLQLSGSPTNDTSYKTISNQVNNKKFVVDSSTYIRYLKTKSSFRK